MTSQFDKLLKAAFDAGAESARHQDDWTTNDGRYVGDGSVPTFEEWRAALPGIDLRDDVIRQGDTVEIVGSERIATWLHQHYGERGIAQASSAGSIYFKVYDPHQGRVIGSGMAWPSSALRKISA